MKKVLLSTLLIFVEGGVHATSYESLVELAGSFDRATADGRRRCYRALRGWYAQNSIWANFTPRERVREILDLIKAKTWELETNGLAFHGDFDVSLAACIIKNESGPTFYPEIINWRFCKETNDSSAQGLTQLTRTTHRLFLMSEYYFFDKTVAFEEIGTRPSLQIELLLQQINENLHINYSAPKMAAFMREKKNCFTQDAPRWEKATMFYDGNDCFRYVRDMRRCRRNCFEETSTEEDIIGCLLR